MNIMFQDKEFFNYLKNNSLSQIEFGSNLYGLNDSESDTDIMYIYSHSDIDNGLFNNHHQLHYKTGKTDHIFTSFKQFIHNLLSGDSTINFEILMSENLPFKILNDNKSCFITYQIIRAYLGFARRDLTKNDKKDFRSINKKLIHGIRSYRFANDLLQNQFNLDCSDLKQYSNIETYIERQEISIEYLTKIESLRNTLKPEDYPRYISSSLQSEIFKYYNEEILTLNQVRISDEIKNKIFDSNLNNISY